MNTQLPKLVANPHYTQKQRQAYFDKTGTVDQRETVPLDSLQFAIDKNEDGRISKNEWIQDTSKLTGNWKGDHPETALYLAKRPGFFGKLFGKEPEFNKASGWVEVPDSGPVRYDTRMLDSIDQKSQTAEIATVFTIPYLREPLYVPQ